VHDGRVAPALACVGFEPPMAGGPVTVRNHRVLPLKAQLLDADGVAVNEDAIAAPLLRVVYDDPASGAAVDVTDGASATGQGTADHAFSFDDADRWHFNLMTRSYTAAGTYHVNMQSGDPAAYAISPTCEATFVIE
jgi:hypothetical protein